MLPKSLRVDRLHRTQAIKLNARRNSNGGPEGEKTSFAAEEGVWGERGGLGCVK